MKITINDDTLPVTELVSSKLDYIGMATYGYVEGVERRLEETTKAFANLVDLMAKKGILNGMEIIEILALYSDENTEVTLEE